MQSCFSGLSRLALPATLLTAAAVCQGSPAIKQPEARCGPYRVLVERVTQSQYLQESLRPAPTTTGRRSAHVQLRLVADNPEAAAGVEIFSVNRVVAEAGARKAEVAHYGGPLENADDCVMRAYVYASDVGLATTRLAAIGGEITAFERAQTVSVDLPLDEIPLQRSSEGVHYSLAAASVQQDEATIALKVQPPAGSQAVAPSGDGAYGIQLLCKNAEGPAMSGSSTAAAGSDGAITFSLTYHGLKGPAPLAGAKLRVPLLLRSGQRRVYPFEIQNIPLPGR